MENKEMEIFVNYGVLGAEKRHIYTYGAEHPYAKCSEKIRVKIPQGWKFYTNYIGKEMVSSPWGWNYEINEVLGGDKYPCFRAFDKKKKKVVIPLEMLKMAGRKETKNDYI